MMRLSCQGGTMFARACSLALVIGLAAACQTVPETGTDNPVAASSAASIIRLPPCMFLPGGCLPPPPPPPPTCEAMPAVLSFEAWDGSPLFADASSQVAIVQVERGDTAERVTLY